MKPKPPLLFVCSMLAIMLIGSTLHARIVTLTVGGTNTADSVSIEANETLELLGGEHGETSSTFTIFKDGRSKRYSLYSYTVGSIPGVIVAGPAKVTLNLKRDNPGQLVFLTMAIKPNSRSAGKTVVLPKGREGKVMLESSTNLVDWVEAVPGMHTNKTSKSFFRVRVLREKAKPAKD